VSPERGSLGLVKIIEELSQGNSGSGIENRNFRFWDFVAMTTRLSSPKSGGRSVGIVRFRTQDTEFFFFCKYNFV
jgi:hypothetical protein